MMIALYFSYSFYIKIKDLAKYSNENNVEIFGKTYKSYRELYSDLNFHNEILSGKNINKSNDKLLVEKLRRIRLDFKFQIIFGTLTFLTVIVQGIK